MGAATAPLTVDQFLRLPEQEIERCELIGGEIVAMGNAGRRHELAKSNILELVFAYVSRHRIGKILSEAMFALDASESFVPDVSLLLNGRLNSENPEKVFDGAPDLAVEVVSSESASKLERKVNKYLEKGSQAVWVVYPEQRTLWVHRSNRVSLHLKEGQDLEADDLLPGFRVPVARFFEEI